MRLKFLTITTVMLMVAAPAAAIMQTDDLLRWCEADRASRAYCDGYMVGFFEGIDVGVSRARWSYCMPDGKINFGQLRQIFIDWAKSHPEHHDLPPSITMVFALRNAFPCDK